MDIELALNANRLKSLVAETTWFQLGWPLNRLDGLAQGCFTTLPGMEASEEEQLHVQTTFVPEVVTPTRVGCVAGLCRNLDIFHATSRLWNGDSVFAHAVEMKFDRFADLRLGLLHRSTGGYTSGNIRHVSREITLGFLDYDGIAHLSLTS